MKGTRKNTEGLLARFDNRRCLIELFIFITYFSTVVPLTSCVFFPVGFSSLTRHFSTGIVVSSVSCLILSPARRQKKLQDLLKMSR